MHYHFYKVNIKSHLGVHYPDRSKWQNITGKEGNKECIANLQVTIKRILVDHIAATKPDCLNNLGNTPPIFPNKRCYFLVNQKMLAK